jgi:hypothetical protein
MPGSLRPDVDRVAHPVPRQLGASCFPLKLAYAFEDLGE